MSARQTVTAEAEEAGDATFEATGHPLFVCARQWLITIVFLLAGGAIAAAIERAVH